MLITTIADFIKFIPTAAGTEFDAIETFLSEAENQLIGLFLGEDMYQYLETIEDVDDKLKKTATRLLCLQAYENAIPFVDLIQTTNGFAVVSNTNLVPASQQRVDRLRDWVSQEIYSTTDVLIRLMLATSEALTEWIKSDRFNQLTNCLFVTGEDFGNYTKVDGSARKALIAAKNSMLGWQVNILQPLISVEYMNQLILEIRANTFTEGSENVLHYCRMILGKLVENDSVGATKLCNALSNILDGDLETYTVYADSPEYALRISPKYVNKLTDPTFFFG